MDSRNGGGQLNKLERVAPGSLRLARAAVTGRNLWTTWFAVSAEPTNPVDPATLSPLRVSICSSRSRSVSFQFTVLKVLAGHPGGRLSAADLTRCVSILISSGSDWTNRTKRLAARAPALDIFSQSFVLRDSAGWQICRGRPSFSRFHRSTFVGTDI